MLTMIFLLLVVLGLGYHRVPALYFHASILGLSLVLTIFVSFAWLLVFVLWLPFAVAKTRHIILTKPLLHFFKKNIPPMSVTEREAIEAGDVWWEADLLSGAPNWQTLLSYPKPALTSEERAFVDNQVETLCGMIDDWAIMNSENQDLPEDIWNYLKRERFMGLIIDKAYGGLGFSALAHSTVVMKIATKSSTVAITMMVPNSLGPGELIHLYGTDEQKNHYLPRLATGEEIPCFALTGTEAGSDAGAMTDTGLVCKGQHDGREVLGIRLNFDKRYITLAPVATLVGLAFKLYDPEHLLGKEDNIGITLSIMPASHPGIEIGRRHNPMSLPFMNGPVCGRDVFIPLDWVIGGKAYVGKGWQLLMECLSIGRAISLPAISTAAGKLSYRMTGAYARLRKQFKLPIAYFEGVEASLARIAGFTYLLEATRSMTAGAVDLGVKPAIASAIAKYHMTEMFRTLVGDAMDIHGGRAVQTGPRNYLTGVYLGIPVAITVEGANILTRNLIIFGQGLIRCHPYLLQEIHMAQAADTTVATFDATLTQHIGFTFANFVRTVWMGLTGSRTTRSPVSGFVAGYYKQLTRMSAALALTSDVALLCLGASLKRRERLSARLGDVLSYLYLASSVLKHYNDAGYPDDEQAYVAWTCDYCLYQIRLVFYEFFCNFPQKFMGKCLKKLIFPWGCHYQKPSDRLDYDIVGPMLLPSTLRDRLTKDIFLGKTKDDITGRVEIALQHAVLAEDSESRLNAAIKAGHVSSVLPIDEQIEKAFHAKLLSESDLSLLREYHCLRHDVLAVDTFDSSVKQREKNYE